MKGSKEGSIVYLKKETLDFGYGYSCLVEIVNFQKPLIVIDTFYQECKVVRLQLVEDKSWVFNFYKCDLELAPLFQATNIYDKFTNNN